MSVARPGRSAVVRGLRGAGVTAAMLTLENRDGDGEAVVDIVSVVNIASASGIHCVRHSRASRGAVAEHC